MLGWKSTRARQGVWREWQFRRRLARLNGSERQRVIADLARPFRRQWFIVDERGVRLLED